MKDDPEFTCPEIAKILRAILDSVKIPLLPNWLRRCS